VQSTIMISAKWNFIASLSTLSLPGVLTSAHINKVDDHRNRENHTQHTSKQRVS